MNDPQNEKPSTEKIVLKHKPDHTTKWMKSEYDLTCPRCAIIDKVIKLVRKSHIIFIDKSTGRAVESGATLEEAETARFLIAKLVSKYGLSKAELVDRLYDSPLNDPPVTPISNGTKKSRTFEEA